MNRKCLSQAFKAALCAALLCGAAGAHAAEVGTRVTNPWMRFTISSRPAAGYFTITNDSRDAHTLVGAESSSCGELMLHQSLHTGGVDRMQMVQSVTVPAHGHVDFAPGSYHLMCTDPAADMQIGKTVAVTLRFSDGGFITSLFEVKGAAGN